MANDNKLGRNSICSCGSGKKFKQCCLGKAHSGTASKSLTWPALVMALGLLGAVLLWTSKGAGAGLAALAASVIAAVSVYVLLDPAPPRANSEDASAINFGGKR